MAPIGKIALVVLILAAVVQADFYMHNMRGSNNRLNENNDNRNSNNRLFDSQNNNRGGYNVGDRTTTAATTAADQAPLHYYETSILRIEWTSQHGSAHEHLNTETIFQYACENQNDGFYGDMTGLRDGTTTTQVNTGNAGSTTVGRHETATYFTNCQTRDRNGGLFHADQTLNGNTAEYTRQNTNGDDSGLECPEERDYYPYWHPSPWKDIVVLTSNTSRCAMYQAQSENVLARNYCSSPQYNNRAQCETNSATWNTGSSFGIAAPDCRLIEYARDNHLGNTIGGETLNYNWTIPTGVAAAGGETRCVLRGRYNISTYDYDGWNTFSDKNGPASPIKDNPTFNFGTGKQVISVKLALNTDQYGRTFQDRSHTFFIKSLTFPGTPAVPAGGMIYNLNVRGRRGNIVEVYPAVEYDYVPNDLYVKAADLVHIQWTGSLTSPNGAGQGAASTDRSNIVCIQGGSHSIPLAFSDPACNMFLAADEVKFATVGIADPTTIDDELDNVPPYYDGGMIQIGAGVPGVYHYMCTRNNSFSNRDQRGKVTVLA
eukprot:c14048_g1_i2.p1 GENE.c14048_g1_i2~~c14048_g1_i2.p1  ORF type:complete len:544 (-),score=121.10 c14048_g1_i2:43-1674(-)